MVRERVCRTHDTSFSFLKFSVSVLFLFLKTELMRVLLVLAVVGCFFITDIFIVFAYSIINLIIENDSRRPRRGIRLPWIITTFPRPLPLWPDLICRLGLSLSACPPRAFLFRRIQNLSLIHVVLEIFFIRVYEGIDLSFPDIGRRLRQ